MSHNKQKRKKKEKAKKDVVTPSRIIQGQRVKMMLAESACPKEYACPLFMDLL